MRILSLLWLLLFACLLSVGENTAQGQAAGLSKLSHEEREQIERERIRLDDRLLTVTANGDLQADTRIFLKGIQWALRYETKFDAKDLALVRNALLRAGQRLDAIVAGKPNWP